MEGGFRGLLVREMFRPWNFHKPKIISRNGFSPRCSRGGKLYLPAQCRTFGGFTLLSKVRREFRRTCPISEIRIRIPRDGVCAGISAHHQSSETRMLPGDWMSKDPSPGNKVS